MTHSSITKSKVIASLVMVFHYFFGLILYPYQTMRKIVKEKDLLQIGFIFLMVYVYFFIANTVRTRALSPFFISSPSFITFSFFLASFFLTVSFFYVMGKLLKMTVSFSALLFSFVYSLFPTIVWFMATSLLYYFLPPPRTFSGYGQLFSIVFVAFSLTLLFWRLILFYLALRFSLSAAFYKIMITILFFLLWYIPLCITLYKLQVFRIPFI